MQNLNLVTLLTAYKSIRNAGLSLFDICNLINWDYAQELANTIDNPIIKLAVKFLKFACSLAPDEQDHVMSMLDNEAHIKQT